MRLIRLITLRSLSTRRLRSFLTLFGIILGVAAMFSINYVNQNAYDSIAQLFEGTSGKTSLEVRNAANIGGFSQDVLDVVQKTEGVAEAFPVLQLLAALPEETPEEMSLSFFGMGSGGFTLYGIDPLKDPSIRDYQVTQGSFLDPSPAKPQIVLVEDYALENEIEVGQTISILTAFGLTDVKIVGLMAKEGAGLTNMGKFGVLELGAAQKIAHREGEIDRIDILSDAGETNPDFLDGLKNDLTLELGDSYAVVYPANQGKQMSQMLTGYQLSLNFMAGIALFVGAFLIYNALSMTVAERSHELGLLRCVGMTRSQVSAQVIIEGFILGILGALAGAGVGILMSKGLTSLMSQILGQPLKTGSIPPDILATSMVIGIFVTLISAFIPAYHAGRISPLEALHVRSRQGGGRLFKYGWIGGLLLLVLSAGILVWNPFPYDIQFRLGSMTVFALFLGATLMIPITLRGWQRISRWPLRMLFGNLGEIGSRNLERAPKRTMLTCAALMVGVSMIVTTLGITGSFTADLNEWMDAYMGGDIFVGAAVPLTRNLQENLESLPGVETATPVRTIEATWLREYKEEKISFMGVDPASYTAVTRFVYSGIEVDQDKALAELSQGGAIFISEVIAQKYGVKIGDLLTLKTRGSNKAFMVAAVVLDFSNQGFVVTGNLSDLEKYFDVEDVNAFYVNATEGVEISETIRQIKGKYQEDYKLIIESNSAIKKRADDLMQQAFSMFDVLGILAVMVAALGVLNTLSMSVAERTREIGMLRSMGMTRFQVVKMILAEAGLMGIIGGLLGLGLGLLLTKILLSAMGAMSGYSLEFIVPTKAIWMSIVVALITSQLAALLPAIRAAKTPMLSAIHYE